MKNKKEFYDEEEFDLLQSVESGEWESTRDIEEIENLFSSAIQNYRKRKKKIELSINTDDFFKLKRISTEKGISTEVLITALIHNYTKGSIALNL